MLVSGPLGLDNIIVLGGAAVSRGRAIFNRAGHSQGSSVQSRCQRQTLHIVSTVCKDADRTREEAPGRPAQQCMCRCEPDAAASAAGTAAAADFSAAAGSIIYQ